VNLDAVRHIFSRVLDTADVGPESDFFALGGDSLLATRVLSAVARESGVELTFDEFVLAPTPSTLTETIARTIAAAAAGSRR
jgi:hypothetical protein